MDILHQRFINQIDWCFSCWGLGFTKQSQKQSRFLYWVNHCALQFLHMVYYLFCQESSNFVKFQQLWGGITMVLIVVKGLNTRIHSDKVEHLYLWFRDIYTNPINPTYRPLRDRHQKNQLREFTIAFW